MPPRRAAFWAAALLLACGGSAQSSGPPSGTGVVTSQQAGGDTAWVRTDLDRGARARSLAATGGTSVVVEIAAPDGGAAVTVAALDGTGELSWSWALASACAPSARPLGSVRDGSFVVAVTTACGAPASAPASDPVPSGDLLRVDGGRGALLGSIAPAGDLAAAGIVQAITTTGGAIVVLSGGATPVVAELEADGTERWRWNLVAARAIAAAPGDEVVVQVGRGPSQLLRIAADGSAARWARDLPPSFDLQAIAVLTDGAVAALGTVAERVEWGRGTAGAPGGTQLALLVLEPDGTARTAASVADAVVGRDALRVAPLPHGRVLITGFAVCERLRALSPQLEPVWERTVDARCGAHVVGAALDGAGQVVVAGWFQGRSDFGSGHVAESAPGVDAPFVLAVWP